MVAIGNFDGVHRGHMATIRKTRSEAARLRAVAVIVTFDPHPQEVLRGESPPVLTTLDRKLELLEEAGVQEACVIPFTNKLARLEPEDFVADILVGALGTVGVVVGGDFRFGRFARGDVPMLRKLGKDMGFEVHPARIVELEGQRVSSTAIRHALGASDLPWANKALRRPHEVTGLVVRGAARGRDLGFPTANLRPTHRCAVPGKGIFAGHVVSPEGRWEAAISVGSNPTFGENPVTIEAYLLDFEGDLYGQTCTYQFEHRLRDEKKFRSVKALRKAMAQDVDDVRRKMAGR